MIICILGTRAQLIKMAPVIKELEKHNHQFYLVFTGQHKESMSELLNDFRISSPQRYLYQGHEITGTFQMAKWFLACLWKAVRYADQYFPMPSDQRNIILIHGDTFSTLLGAIIGKLARTQVAHVESGLRSFNMLNPFPEEITRLLTFRLSNIAFCPGAWAYENMKYYKLLRINTQQNTIVDTLKYAVQAKNEYNDITQERDYGVFSIHRFENIFVKRRLRTIVKLLEKAATYYPIIFVLHPATKIRLERLGLLSRLEQNRAINLIPRMGYIRFIRLVSKARFVITDGGSNQEELSYLGIPTLLMRKVTERREGLNSTVALCNYDESLLIGFIDNLGKFAQTPALDIDVSPSQIIVNHLKSFATNSNQSMLIERSE